MALFILPPAIHAQSFLSKDEALAIIFQSECGHIRHVQHSMPDSLWTQLERRGIEPEERGVIHIFLCETKDETTSYALIDNEIGKHRPITYIVGITPAGIVSGVEIMVYRETHGGQIRRRTFLEQYRGRSSSDSFQVGREIENITGATLSAKAISRGVQRDLFIWTYFFGGATGEEKDERSSGSRL